MTLPGERWNAHQFLGRSLRASDTVPRLRTWVGGSRKVERCEHQVDAELKATVYLTRSADSETVLIEAP